MRILRILSVLLFCSWLIFPIPTLSQTKDSLISPVSLVLKNDSMVSKPFSSGFQMKKSPWEATWRSMAIPGWGQYYTEQYWKVPLILGGVGFLLYKIIGNNNLYLNYDRQYSSGNLQGNDLALALNYREFYRDVRDEYGLYLLALYLVNIIDAYVDAHLFDFDVSDKLGAQLQLMPTGRFGISVRW